jgi:hypothetical protein
MNQTDAEEILMDQLDGAWRRALAADRPDRWYALQHQLADLSRCLEPVADDPLLALCRDADQVARGHVRRLASR